MKRDSRSPQHYVNSVEPPLREILDRIRRLLHQVAPDVEEGIQYGMLAYPGIACLGAQKAYVSLYVSPAALARYRDAHPESNGGKSCLRFRPTDVLDEEAIRRLLLDARRQGQGAD